MRVVLVFIVLSLVSACAIPTQANVLAATVQPTPTISQADSPLATPTSTETPAAALPSDSPTLTATSAPEPAAVQPDGAYDMGQPVLTDFYVSASGSDSQDGLSPDTAFRTITAAWNQIPEQNPLSGSGYRINILPGEYPCEPQEPDNCLNYFSDRHGTAQFPIIVRAAQGPGTVTVRGGFDFNHLSYLYLMDFTLAGGMPLPTNASGNNLLHLAQVDHVLLRGMTLDGPDCNNDSCNNLQEVLKVNQAQYLYVENSTIGGAWHSAVDYFSVQYGHFVNNRVHTAGQWCMYIKGGTSYLHIDSNELHDCQLGFQAGQSSNMAMMRAPWLHYEAYDIKFVNNVLHDMPGVGVSVSGGYNVLIAYNTLFRVATSTDPGYALLQAVPGERGCNATDELQNPVPTCTDLATQGAWGPTILTDNLPAIPNRNIYVYNNLIYNPDPARSLYTHFDILPAIDLPDGFQNLPAQVATDNNLVIKGNVIWNGPADHPLGVDENTGCPPANATCNPTQLAADNTINRLEPGLANPTAGDYHPVLDFLSAVSIVPIPDFTWDTFSPAVPAGTPSNAVLLDCDGQPRTPSSPPGAYTSESTPPAQSIYLPVVRHS